MDFIHCLKYENLDVGCEEIVFAQLQNCKTTLTIYPIHAPYANDGSLNRGHFF